MDAQAPQDKSESEKNANTSNMEEEIKTDYFQSYENLDVHRLMLQDKVRTKAYETAIENSKNLFKDKIVMDVGAGTGILSMMCARAGCKKVYAVEASNVAKLLPAVFEKNGFGEIIEVIFSKVEDITRDIKVDIIVSEWMGFYLLHESMLDSVLYARDKFLKENGLMYPTEANIYAAACTAPEVWKKQVGYWADKQYGFDLSTFVDVAKAQIKPEITKVNSESLLSDPQLVWNLDLKNIQPSDLEILEDRRFFSIEQDGDLHGVCLWFSCIFPHDSESVPEDDFEQITTLCTGPHSPSTHWEQTVILFPEVENYEEGDVMGWSLIFKKPKAEDNNVSNKRSYVIEIGCLDPATEEHPVPCACGVVKCELIRYMLKEGGKSGCAPDEDELETDESMKSE